MTNSTDQLRQNCRAIADELQCVDTSPHRILQDALSIEFTSDQGRNYLGARILVAFGGPNIWIDTRNDTVEGYLGCDRVELRFDDVNDLHEACEDLFECHS